MDYQQINHWYVSLGWCTLKLFFLQWVEQIVGKEQNTTSVDYFLKKIGYKREKILYFLVISVSYKTNRQYT